MSSTTANKISPFELTTRAYQGAYAAQGIRGFGSLRTDISSGKTTAKDLIRTAIEAKDLPPEIETDRAYLNAVEAQLFGVRN